ncbi:2-desacetyl-2-hydroxyethyl bacteriochlorophyllide A dehydrogenase [Kutzneria buriramensis]|uniref:2-desacetyl-2-hydroxyethyl bacteriochlorophyllide A dehydrogenase n=1 Tax=Kutzneria buriramensis TaxID=1045776 RepID=A0A3E0H6P1_9PSEU|nr:2-desacetyl-2-hydroxyethyl bacteriochlorophyllide A dehydrogenase [Kutzneria buriramensis]
MPLEGIPPLTTELPETMRAVRFHADTRELRLETVPVPRPGPTEVVVKVAACGICHSDLSQFDGHIPAQLPVITPGHEASGTIAAVGGAVRHWQVGDRVVIAAGRACGKCRSCAFGGNIDDCEALEVMAFAYDGAWAEYVVTPGVSLIAVPDGVPMEQAAVLADAVSTPYGALETAGLRMAESVGVWGMGGIGSHLVQLARIAGASPVIGLDPVTGVRERALSLGADFVLDPLAEDTPARIMEITDGRGLRAAFDCVGRTSTVAQANGVLATRGRLLLVGISGEPIELGREGAFLARRHTVTGHLGYKMRHLDELVELVSRGRLDLSASVSAVLPLDEFDEGIRRLREHDGNPIRVLLRP